MARSKEVRIEGILLLLEGLTLGAGAMFLMDPNAGRRRRAMLGDKLRHARRISTSVLSKSSRDINHRTRGLLAETRARFVVEHVPDDILVERVRSKIGRIVSHPHSIEINARNGNVSISGPVLAEQAQDIIDCVSRVRGVNSVIDNLAVHGADEAFLDIQGDRYSAARMNIFSPVRLVGYATLSGLLFGSAIFAIRRNFIAAGLCTLATILFARGYGEPGKASAKSHAAGSRSETRHMTTVQ